MKIKTKLALLFTSITISIFIIVFSFVYIITSKTIDNNYYTLLLDKALITAQKNFEKDELNKFLYQKILDTYQSLLPETSERIIVANDKQEAILELITFLDREQAEKLLSETQIKFELDDLYGVGIYYPDNEGNFIIIVTAQNLQGEYIKAKLKNILLVVLLISSLLIFGLLWWNASIITKPLQEMVVRMQEISAKDLHLRLKERKGNDELAQTINYFNRMIERLEVSFNSQKSFIANASHELRNPLTAIIGECEVMQLKGFSVIEYKDSIKRIEYEIDRLNKLVNNLLQLAQTDLDISESYIEELDVVQELQELVNYFELTKYKGRIHFLPNYSFNINANKHLLFIAIENIIDNACKYSDKQVVVETLINKHRFEAIIRDQGIGIPEDEKEKIFNTFYRAKNTFNYEGSGIGLSLSYKIIKLFGAELKIESSINKGTIASILWVK
ncbi:MAG: HAMP domain-containing sensor histidine kinase [Bacteroidales bacterium]|nr:HAMP domain-containing sensor histidine kinase [Bacteroidales bacterium]MDD4683687.1 HAMP domain-containing sensor histidine kinase [Bacteroidales bacterium]